MLATHPSHVVLQDCYGDDNSTPVHFIAADEWSGGIVVAQGKMLSLMGHEQKIHLVDTGLSLAQRSSDTELWAVLYATNHLIIYEDSEVIAESIFHNQRIMALHWLNSSYAQLLISSSSSISFFNVDRKTKSLHMVRSQTRNTFDEWFLPSFKMLLCVNVKNRFDIWEMKDAGPKKLSSFAIGVILDASPEEVSRQVRFVEIYGRPTLLLVEEAAGKLHVYAVERGSLRQTHTFGLFSPGPFHLFVVDNVILAISYDKCHLPLLFDVQEATGSCPLVSPLPMQFTLDLEGVEWKALLPDKMVFAKNGNAKKLTLCLDFIIDSWGNADPDSLISFLCRRHGGEMYILKVVRHFALQENFSSRLSRSLTSLAVSSFQKSKPHAQPSNLQHHHSFISQVEIVDVFRQLMPIASLRHLEAICIEFFESLVTHHIVPCDLLVFLIVDVLVGSSRFHQLQQFAQYHMFPDTIELARLLCKTGSELHEPLSQLGLDMMHRLGAYDCILDTMLMEVPNSNLPREIVLALRFIQTRSAYFEKIGEPNPRRFLLLALSSGCRSTLVDVFHHFQLRNLSRFGDGKFRHEDDCEEFVILYNNLMNEDRDMSFSASGVQEL
uniref:Mic1 domain-containing protein n=1 Tax=Spongospora subterranea TaxID=70186 RepID=A0A0H5QIR3_9EUKA|eukprot:CRZ01878.1 hypothetical protein [Spongospora subterranea]